MQRSKYIREVTKLLASLDGQQENGKPEPETEIPDTGEPIEDVYVLIFREREALQDEQVIDSTLTEPDTNVPYAPTLQPLTPEQARDEKRSKQLGLFTMSLLLFLCLASIALQIHLILNPPVAIITIIPKSQQITLTGTLQLGRVLSPITISQSATTQATGKGHQDAKQAQGYITFYNGQSNQVTIPAGTYLTGSDGVQITTDQDANIPPLDPNANPPAVGQITIPAHTVNPGSRGNIPAYDISQLCCFASIVAKNTAPFHGGQDERSYQVVTKTDITQAATTIKATVTQGIKAALQGQLKNGEALKANPCSPIVTTDHNIGAEATQVKVTASETCSGIAYDTQTLESKVTALLTAQVIANLGAGYSILGNPQVSITQATAQNTKVVISFNAQSAWVYALSSAEQQHIKKIIAGKTKEKAMQLLLLLPGIERVSIQWSDDTKLPKNIQYIHLVIIAGV